MVGASSIFESKSLVKAVLAGFLLLCLSGSSAHATDIAWRSTIAEDNQDSSSQPLNSSWSFYLGYFTGGFVPTAGNTTLWAQNWMTVDVASYGGAFTRFVGLWENTGAVTIGTKGYIWGVDRNSAAPEWILMSDAGWNWPSSANNPIDPSDDEVVWQVSGATEITIGEVNTGGVHMRTAPATGSPPLLIGEDWLVLHFLPTEQMDLQISGWDADPDEDGKNNLLEFALGTDPRGGADLALVEVGLKELGSSFLTVTVPKARNVAVVYTGQVGNSLTGWSTGAPHVVVDSESEAEIIFRDATPLSANSQRFARVHVALAP